MYLSLSSFRGQGTISRRKRHLKIPVQSVVAVPVFFSRSAFACLSQGIRRSSAATARLPGQITIYFSTKNTASTYINVLIFFSFAFPHTRLITT